jgi:hypothetical protein
MNRACFSQNINLHEQKLHASSLAEAGQAIRPLKNNFVRMKRLLLSLTVFGLCLVVTGQDPESFNYKTIIRNGAGEPVVSKTVSVRTSIVLENNRDSVIYSELHHPETNQEGLVSLTIGEGSVKTGDMSDIDWNANKYFLKIETDTNGGSDYSNAVTTQILVIPYILPPNTLKKASPDVLEERLFLSRKYAGKFIDYRHSGPTTFNGPNIIWIKTSMESTFGKISAYGKKCRFLAGDNLYLKRTFYNPGGISGYWVYQIENDSSVYYRLTDFQYDHKVVLETLFK